MDDEYGFWKITYISCEGNERWYLIRCPASWTHYDVEVKAHSFLGGCGDDMAEIVSIEEASSDKLYCEWD